MDGETSLDIVDQTEVFTSLFDGDNIHEASWEVSVGADLAVNLDQTLHDDLGHLAVGLEKNAINSKLVWHILVAFSRTRSTGEQVWPAKSIGRVATTWHIIRCHALHTYQSILQAITQEDDKRQRLAQLVWAS